MNVLFSPIKSVASPVFIGLLVCCGFTLVANAADVLISGGTVIDVYSGKQSVKDIVIQDDEIAFVGTVDMTELPQDIRKIDAAGKYIIPGLWDMHVHLTFYPELKERLPSLYIANGVTSVRDMGSQLDEVLEFREHLSQKDEIGPRIWLAGPIVDGSPRIFDGSDLFQPNIGMAVNSPKEAIAAVDYLAAKGVDLIKPYVGLSPETFFALVKQAKVHHLPVAGHIPNRVSLAEAVSVGMDDIQHLGSHHGQEDCKQLDKPAPHSKTSVIVKASSVTCTALIDQFAEQRTWHTPTLVNTVGPEALGFYEDPIWASAYGYLPQTLAMAMEKVRKKFDGTFYKSDLSVEMFKKMHKAGVKFLAATDSPPTPNLTPGFGLHFELKAMVQAGLTPLEALQAATINPAAFFGAEHTQGSIAKGYVADLILLDANPLLDINNTQKINTVVSRGRIFDRKALDSLLEF